MATFELSDDQVDALVRYLRAKLDAERFPNWSACQPLREALDVLAPPKARVPSQPLKIYAPPRATAQQQRGGGSAMMIDARLLQDLHDSEINGSIDWLFDGAWSVTMGNPVYAQANVSSVEEAIAWLRDEAVRPFPDSPFGQKYGRGFF